MKVHRVWRISFGLVRTSMWSERGIFLDDGGCALASGESFMPTAMRPDMKSFGHYLSKLKTMRTLSIWDDHYVIDLITQDGECHGALLLRPDGS